MSQPDSDAQVSAVRAFNRFYTRKLGVLDQQLLKSPFSLSEARVLYELAHRGNLAAKEIGIELGLDPGYLSRIIQKFDDDGLITRKPLASDRRQYQLGLTAKGRQAFAKVERSSHDDVAAMLAALPPGGVQRLIEAMTAIEHLLGAPQGPPPPAILRDPRPGDMGWVVQSHGELYAREYGFDSSFEALVAEIAANSSPPSTPPANAAGSPISTARRSARCFWSGTATTSPSCDCCWWIPPGADRDWDAGWSVSAFRLPANAAIAGSRCGPRAFSWPRAKSIRTWASCWSPPSRTAVSARA